eukprot:scaffold9352_cov123-Skeletonema_marinoi.AAC.5
MKGRIRVQIERPSTNSSTLESGGGGGGSSSSSSGRRQIDCACELECKCGRSGQKLLPPQSSSSSRSPTSQFEYDNMMRTNIMNATHQTRDFVGLQRSRSKKRISAPVHAVVYEDMIISFSNEKKSPPLPNGNDEDDETLTLNDNEDMAEDIVVCADKSDDFGFTELVNDIVNLTSEDFGMSDFVESILSPVTDATESMCSPHESAFTDMLQDDAVANASESLSKELHDLIFENFPEEAGAGEEATAAEDAGVGELIRDVIIRGEDVDVDVEEYISPGKHVGKDVDQNIAPCFRIPSTVDVKSGAGVTSPDPDTNRCNDYCCWWWWRRS